MTPTNKAESMGNEEMGSSVAGVQAGPDGPTDAPTSAGLSGPAWIWAETADEFVQQLAGLTHRDDWGYIASDEWDDDGDSLNALILRARQIRDLPLRHGLADELAAESGGTASPKSEGQHELEWDTAPLGEVLWGVYGPDCFPSIFACKILDHPEQGRVLWGFSIYRRSPGFRTLGVSSLWAEQHGLHLFRTQAGAFSFISNLFAKAVQS